jgi:hypothetical protein
LWDSMYIEVRVIPPSWGVGGRWGRPMARRAMRADRLRGAKASARRASGASDRAQAIRRKLRWNRRGAASRKIG